MIDAASLPSRLVRHDERGWLLRDLSEQPVTITDGPPTRGWVRRYSPPGWDHGARIGSHRAAVLTARLALLGALLRDSGIGWLTPADEVAMAENKLLQYKSAARVGARVPRTVVSGDLDEVVAMLGEPFIAKPLGAAHFERDGEARIAYAEPVNAADLAGTDLLEAPFLMQEMIRARWHLRVITVGERAWVCAQAAEGLPVDWRRVDRAHGGFGLTSQHVDVARQAVAIAAAMGVGYSSQDWVDDGHEPCFLDLNPAGQWAFLPDAVADEVSDAIAGWLLGDGGNCG